MYFVHFYFVIEKKKSHLFVLNFLFKIVMGQPNFRHSDCQLCIFLQPYICFNYYKNNTFFRFSFFFSFVQTNLLSGFQMIVCYSALWRDWHQNIELNTLSEQRVLL